MERTSKNPLILAAALVVVSAGGALGASVVAQAGTRLVTPAQENNARPDGEPYAESRFGSAPAPIEPGIRRGYASRAVEEMEEVEDRAPASRAPAGMLFASEGRAPRKGVARASGPALITEASERSPDLEPAVANPRDLASSSVVRLPDAGAVFRKGIQEVSLIAADLGFFPKTVFVTRDVPVRLFVTGASKNTLCIMMDSFGVRRQVRNQRIEEITFTPSTPGQYRFYCPVNGMEGTLVVRELAGAPGAATEAADASDAPAPIPAQGPARRVAATRSPR